MTSSTLSSIPMKCETVSYIPLKPPWAISDIVIGLPEWVQKQLSYDPREAYVTVDTVKKDVVEYLDRAFRVSHSNAFKKMVKLEIDRAEIDSYDYFIIMPKVYQLGKGIFGSVKRPTCDSESCPVGASLVLPLRITPTLCRRIGIGFLHHLWPQYWEFLLSSKVKHIFESEGITGLEYAPCIVETSKGKSVKDVEPLHLAKPIHLTEDYAESITINKGTFCEKHSVIFSYQMMGHHVRRSNLSGHDFACVERVSIGAREYRYSRHHLIVSRKVVKSLLNHRISGLVPIGFYHGERFLPIMATGAEQSEFNY